MFDNDNIEILSVRRDYHDADDDDNDDDPPRIPPPAVVPPPLVPVMHPPPVVPPPQPGQVEINNIINNIVAHNCGEMLNRCVHCNARYFRGEINAHGLYTKCCSNGQVVIPAFHEVPQRLRDLYLNDDAESREFRNNIIVYNKCFQFASIEANLRDIPG